jgi:hypothetical protein
MINGCPIKELKIMVHAHPRSLPLPTTLVIEGLRSPSFAFVFQERATTPYLGSVIFSAKSACVR